MYLFNTISPYFGSVRPASLFVIAAKAGTQAKKDVSLQWVPAFAGMTFAGGSEPIQRELV